MKFPIYVISLARSPERSANIAEQLDSASVNYEWFDAVDGRALDLTQYKSRLRLDLFRANYKREMERGEIGCYLSHYQIWQRMSDEQTPVALIMEDDAVLKPGFQHVVAALPNTRHYWEYVQLSYHRTKPIARKIESLTKCYTLVEGLRAGGDACAYMINLTGACKLLNSHWYIDSAVDAKIRTQYYQIGLVAYDVIPPPVAQSGVETTIGVPKISHPKDIKYKLRKIYRSARRRIYRFNHPPKLKD